ncbi:MAG: RHS repeat-associated core domain-containing protein [Novipirellula sp. JB048]
MLTRGFANRGQLARLATGTSTTIDTRSCDDGGRLLSRRYNDGVSETRTYNTDNTLAGIAFTGASIGDLSYGWDANKNKTSEAIAGTMSGYGFDVGAAGYDDEDRLINWNRDDNALDQAWNLSLVGDWNTFTENANVQPRTRTHGPTHELLTAAGQAVQHDAKGNQTSIPAVLRVSPSPSLPLSLHWDFENKLRGADVDGDATDDVTYQFDAMGRRVGRDDGTPATVFVQSGQQTIADYTAGTVASSPTYRYVYASYIDEPVMRAGSTSTARLYYHRNQQYSVTALTDTTGSIVERYAYDAYGKLTVTDGAGTSVSGSAYGNRYTYTGREWDGELGLYHYRARMYSPDSGRFVSRDPIGYEGGISLYRAYFLLQRSDRV